MHGNRRIKNRPLHSQRCEYGNESHAVALTGNHRLHKSGNLLLQFLVFNCNCPKALSMRCHFHVNRPEQEASVFINVTQKGLAKFHQVQPNTTNFARHQMTFPLWSRVIAVVTEQRSFRSVPDRKHSVAIDGQPKAFYKSRISVATESFKNVSWLLTRSIRAQTFVQPETAKTEFMPVKAISRFWIEVMSTADYHHCVGRNKISLQSKQGRKTLVYVAAMSFEFLAACYWYVLFIFLSLSQFIDLLVLSLWISV